MWNWRVALACQVAHANDDWDRGAARRETLLSRRIEMSFVWDELCLFSVIKDATPTRCVQWQLHSEADGYKSPINTFRNMELALTWFCSHTQTANRNLNSPKQQLRCREGPNYVTTCRITVKKDNCILYWWVNNRKLQIQAFLPFNSSSSISARQTWTSAGCVRKCLVIRFLWFCSCTETIPCMSMDHNKIPASAQPAKSAVNRKTDVK